MDSRDLELSRPCPIDLDSLGVDRRQRRVFCSHCSAHVTDISQMREAEASRFVADNRGSGVCISCLRDEEGNVYFADSVHRGVESRADGAPPSARRSPSLVPVERLRHPAVRRAAAVAALALAACTPHAEHDEAYVESMDEVVMERSTPEIPLAIDPLEPEDFPPGLEDEDRPVVPEVVDEPCDPELPGKATATPKKRMRGGLKRRAPAKPKPDFDRVDGGI